MRPTNITADRPARKLLITWSDGHASAYPFSLLRFACPCAECRGGHDRMGQLPDAAVFSRPDEDSAATRLKNVELVGSYALMIEWEDGHHYGIYNWQYLRAACPCPTCRPQG